MKLLDAQPYHPQRAPWYIRQYRRVLPAAALLADWVVSGASIWLALYLNGDGGYHGYGIVLVGLVGIIASRLSRVTIFDFSGGAK